MFVVVFYGFNLCIGLFDGVFDFYVLLLGLCECGIWLCVSYYEWDVVGVMLCVKVVMMMLVMFVVVVCGELVDMMIWVCFV